MFRLFGEPVGKVAFKQRTRPTLLLISVVAISFCFITFSSAIAEQLPEPCASGCRYSFDIAGRVQNISPSSPLYKFNNGTYTVKGSFTSSGALNVTDITVDAPTSCTSNCRASIDPDTCGGGCLTGVSSGGIYTVSLNMPLNGTFGTATNINTQPTFKLLFPDPTGTMTLANLPTVFSQLQAIQFPTLHLSTTGLSETWAPSVSNFDLGVINSDDAPIPCGSGCKYSFSLSGKVQGINPASPLYQYNGDNYIVSGVFNGGGVLNIDTLKVAAADPNSCSGGGCVAEIEPDS